MRSNFFFVQNGQIRQSIQWTGGYCWAKYGNLKILKAQHALRSPNANAYEMRLSNIFYFMFWLHCNGFFVEDAVVLWARVYRTSSKTHDRITHETTCSCRQQQIAMVFCSESTHCVSVQVCVLNKEIKHYYYCLQSRHNIFSIFLVPSPSSPHRECALMYASVFFFFPFFCRSLLIILFVLF